MNNPVLVILAAGMGTRYGGQPGLKQIDPVGPNGEIILDYSIYDAIKAGFKKVVFVIREEMEDIFRSTIGARVENKIETAYAFQKLDDLPQGYAVPEGREKPWGTAHAVLAARKVTDEPFVVINADDYYGRNTFEAMAEFLRNVDPQSRDFSMAGFAIENTVSDNGGVNRGICVVKDGFMTSVKECKGITRVDGVISYKEGGEVVVLPVGTPVSMNTWGLTPVFFDDLMNIMPSCIDGMEDKTKGEYLLPYAFSALIEEGMASVRVLNTNEKWFGVTYKEDKPSVVAAIADMINNGVYPENLWK